jgi:hypothetical protein
MVLPLGTKHAVFFCRRQVAYVTPPALFVCLSMGTSASKMRLLQRFEIVININQP